MITAAISRQTWRHAARLRHQIIRRMARHRSATTLLLLLMWGLCQPLACLLHCPIWPWSPTALLTADHHHGHTPTAIAPAHTVALLAAVPTATATPAEPLCHLFMSSGPLLGSASSNWLPSFDYTIAQLVAALVLIPLIIGRWRLRLIREHPPDIYHPPTLRPPITIPA